MVWKLVALLLLALDWAALHDIARREPDPYGEYGVIFVSLVVSGIMISMAMWGGMGEAVPDAEGLILLWREELGR